jgi:DNA topoisomerase-1
MPKSLVIVESPAKAKTISRFLGKDFRVEASFGHIRDLPESADEVPAEIRDKPWANLGVDTEGDFKPYYVVPASKKRHVAALRAAMKGVSEVLLATDPDREGESISLHLREVLKPKVPVRRVTFHEITREAVQEAVANAHELDDNLVKAQESRRILDRLYGYTLSPVLWKKVRTGLSAGRVQSVAVRLIVEREEARRAFRSSTYWDIEATLSAEGREFDAALTRIGDERVATGRDFDSATGRLSARGVRHLNEQGATALAGALEEHLPWEVTAVDERPGTERPAPPFTTSTLTQEASRKLGFSTSRTMRIAQRLKDGVELADGTIEGLITYHRTDSTTISEKALTESGRAIREMFGDEYYSGPRRYQTQVRNAQEAHEAIRPTDFNVTPQSVANVLEADELRLYDLVWKRTMASQMPDAKVLKTTVEFTATGLDGERCVLAATGKAIEYAGFRRAYVEGSDDPDSELEAQETILPVFKPGDLVVGGGTAAGDRRARASLARLEPKRHETTPPARFTEASLIKKLEEAGIGRPSTYEPTIETILRRGYVFRQGKALVPSFTAFAVTGLLRDHFEDFVDIGFTAEMEKDLDEISNGERPWLDFIREFFRGDGRQHKGLEAMARDEEQHIDYPVVIIGTDPETGSEIRVRIGRFGPFLQLGDGGPGNTASLPDDLPPGDLTAERAMSLIRAKAAGPRQLGADPATGQPVYLATGRFGPYVQLGDTPEKPPKAAKGAKAPKGAKATKGDKAAKPRRASLPRGVAEGDVDLSLALRLLSLPRVLGPHPGDGQEVVSSAGRFGPYVKHGDEFRSLEPDDDVYTVGLERALALLAAPKQARRRQSATRTVLRELGVREDTGATVTLLDGRYGPYVSDGKTNASLAKGADPASVGLREAVELLEARAAAGPSKKPTRRGAAGGSRRRKPPAGVS